MKFLRKLLLPSIICFALTLGGGCKNQQKYTVYTNMPDGAYTLEDKSFTVEKIGGYTAPDPVYEEVDTSAYTSIGYSFPAMYVEADVVVMDDFTKDAAQETYSLFKTEVNTLLKNISNCLSSTVENSDIYNFNNAAAGARLEISQITYEVLKEALAVHKLTEGFYNPALYYNINAYGFGSAHKIPENSSYLPDDETVAKYTDLAKHFNEIEIAAQDNKYFVTKPEYTVEADGETLSLKLDLGGIGKGYAVDRVEELYDIYGYKFGYFNFAASSMLVKSNSQSGAFNLGFTNPRSLGKQYLKTTVRDEKLSTSGDNEQFYNLDGVRYCHIISPETGKPVQTGIMSVTILGGGAAEDDALTTALMCMGRERAVKFIEEKLTDRRVVFICE
ncbi:MAG: FAD:protein FMN transferase [Clostridia bacterium]|nr:FAD:protein FMN transferase [Clostridia bacterium]